MQHHTHDHEVVVSEGAEYYHTSVDQQGLRDDALMEEYSEKAAPPPKRRFYKTKKYWIICSIITVIVVIVVVLLALFVIFPKIAQSLMNKSKIDVTAAGITFVKPESLNNANYGEGQPDNMNTTFYMNMESDLSNTGPFHATIKFQNPIQVLYEDKYLGDIYLYDETKIAGGKGKLNAVTPFMIRDEAAFTEFSKTMLAVEEFRWTLKGKLDITALSRTATVDLNKEIVLYGMNGFPNVKIDSFNLPGDDPNGGILVELGTTMESPSPIGVQLGTIKLAIGYDGVNLGVVAAEGITLQKGENKLVLKGTLVPHNDTAELEKVGVLFSNYLSGAVSNTTAVGLTSAPDGVNAIGWLSEAFKTVKLNVALGVPEPLKIINSVSMGYLDLKFDPAAPYAPVINAPEVTVGFQMPFGFSINVTEVTQSITLGLGDANNAATPNDFAVMTVPYVSAVSDQAAGTIKLALLNTALTGVTGKESVYNEYTYALTASSNYSFMVTGVASTKANTPIGPVILSGINFTVPTSLQGLQFLNSSATVINSLDVTGGTSSGLSLAIDVTMSNPSDFGISTGDVTFDMGASGTTLGLVALNNLTLNRGENRVMAAATFDPKSSDVGQNLLSTFVMGQNNGVDILGRSDSTSIASLAQALSAISLGSTLPGLQTALIQGSSLIVNDDTVSTSIVGVKVSIANPFTAGLSISKVVSGVTFNGMPIGNIDQDISSNPFIIGGKSTAESFPLSMSMNLEPGAVALLLRTLAVQSNLDTRPIDALFTMGGIEVDGQENIEADPSLFETFDISKFVMDAMSSLKVDLSLSSTLTIGEYVNDLAFSQGGVAVATDKSVTALIPIVGQPIVQQIVAGSVLAFETVIMSDVTESSFKVQMKGSIKNTGPMAAKISFPTPLTVRWQGKVIGKVTMADLNAKPLIGAQFDVPGVFTVENSNDMAEFAAYLINNKDFVWDITSSDVSVSALGFTFNKISLHKIVTLAGASGFKDAVKVTSFDLPANDPEGGITLKVNTMINNPSQVGFSLGGVGFANYFGDVYLGPLLSDGPAIFAPRTASNVPMKGRLVPQTTQEGIVAITKVFGAYLSGNDTTLTVKGESGSGSGGTVSWLTSAFKTLTIENVILPGPDVIPELIPSIEMRNIQLDFTKDPWAPPASSTQVEAQLHSPFGFPMGVSQLNMNVAATYDGHQVATLDVPDNAATTSPTGIVTTSFSDVPFKVSDKQIFAGFVQLLTLGPSVTFGLEGTANAVAQTAVGNLYLPGVTFNVPTTLKGFKSFNNKATVTSLKVAGATIGYVIVELTVELDNPSDVTINVGDINFEVMLPKFDARIGMVYMKDTIIPPGVKSYKATMHLGEKATDPIAVGYMLIAYLSNAPVDLIIQGTSTSTSIAPLVPALSSLKLLSSINGIEAGLIKSLHIHGDFMSMAGPPFQAFIDLNLYNPLDTPFQIIKIDAVSTKDVNCNIFGEQFMGPGKPAGTIKHTFDPPLVLQPGETREVKNLVAQLGEVIEGNLLILLGDKKLDVTQVAEVVVGDGFHVEAMTYSQKGIEFTAEVPGITDAPEMSVCNVGDPVPSSLVALAEPEAITTTAAAATTTEAAQPTQEPVTTTEAPVAPEEPTPTPEAAPAA